MQPHLEQCCDHVSHQNSHDGETAMTSPIWRQHLRAAQKREGHAAHARWVQLATVNKDGCPRVRTVVFRGWVGDAQLDLFSDARSSKFSDLIHQPEAEICWLFPKAKQQYRFRGVIDILRPDNDSDTCHQAWKNLTPRGRAVWTWPPPGSPFDDQDAFSINVDDTQPLPEHFRILRLAINRAELLDLKGDVHKRLLWTHSNQLWMEERLNP